MSTIRGSLDAPADGASVGSAEVEVAGWAFCDRGLPLAVVVTVNGEAREVALPGEARLDVGDAFPDHADAGWSGWRCLLDLSTLAGTRAAIEVSALGADGTLTPLGRSEALLVESGRRWRGALDQPTPATLASGALRVAGWCDFGGEGAGSVSVAVGGEAPVRARLGTPRPDVAGRLADSRAIIGGFEAIVPIPSRLVGQDVDVVATGTSAAGEMHEIGVVRIGCRAPTEATDEELRRAAVLRRRVPPAKPVDGVRAPALRMLIATHSLTTGGAQRWLSDLLGRFRAAHPLSVTLLAAEAGPQALELEEAGCDVVVVGQPSVASIAGYEGHLEVLASWLATRGPFDVALVNTVGMFPVTDLAHRLGIPTVWAIHESYDLPVYWEVAYPGGIHPYVRRRGEEALRDTPVALFVAEATRLQYEQWLGPEASLRNVSGAIELERFAACEAIDPAAARRQLGLPPPPTPVLLCLGSVEPRKGQTALARAFLQATEGNDAVLAVVGPDAGEAYGTALREYLAAADRTGKVRIEPVTSDPITWMRAADVLVSASDVESLPLVLLEAMAAGTPTLATSIYGVPEIIVDGQTGWLVPPNDEAALVQGIRRALSSSPAERRRITDAARQRVMQDHSFKSYSAHIWALLTAAAATT